MGMVYEYNEADKKILFPWMFDKLIRKFLVTIVTVAKEDYSINDLPTGNIDARIKELKGLIDNAIDVRDKGQFCKLSREYDMLLRQR